MVLWGIATPILFYGLTLTIHKRSSVGGFAIAVLFVSSVAWMASSLKMVTQRRAPLGIVAVKITAAALWLFVTFALIYWNIGTPRNFGHSLSHLDSAYFMLGILTTAGTGSIAPQSESARLVVTLQYVVDLGFMALVLGVFASRLAERRPSK